MNISHAIPNISLWARRLALYFSLGTVVIVITHVFFSYFGFLHTDVDSARYMLSALIQSEAAIVALVVTLSLVAVQLAASSYSARVIEVFRKAPDMWILMRLSRCNSHIGNIQKHLNPDSNLLTCFTHENTAGLRSPLSH